MCYQQFDALCLPFCQVLVSAVSRVHSFPCKILSNSGEFHGSPERNATLNKPRTDYHVLSNCEENMKFCGKRKIPQLSTKFHSRRKTGMLNPMKMSDIGFLKTELN